MLVRPSAMLQGILRYHNISVVGESVVAYHLSIDSADTGILFSLIMSQSRKGPFRLVTVNTAPERAKRLIGRMIEGLQDCYEIEHIANCSSAY
jgi:hypothetical protein